MQSAPAVPSPIRNAIVVDLHTARAERATVSLNVTGPS